MWVTGVQTCALPICGWFCFICNLHDELVVMIYVDDLSGIYILNCVKFWNIEIYFELSISLRSVAVGKEILGSPTIWLCRWSTDWRSTWQIICLCQQPTLGKELSWTPLICLYRWLYDITLSKDCVFADGQQKTHSAMIGATWLRRLRLVTAV